MKAVLITGGAKRVGAGLALHFAQNGYDIALHYHHSDKDALALQKSIEKMGQACALFQQDLSDTTTFPALMKKVQKALPHCSALINNASIFERVAFMQTDEALFDRQFAINFKAPFFLTQAFAKTFGKGCVINMLDTKITSTHGSHFAYLLSKKALADFTEMAARELGPYIRVNGVCPGSILPSNQNDKDYDKKTAATIPLKQNPDVAAVAQAAYWLAMQEHITGQVIFVDGGQHVL